METMDEEITASAMDFMERQVKADKPFFLWWNSTKMHIWTHLKKECEGVTGLGVTADGMVEHDRQVGQMLAKLEELGIADNTIVMYSTDNGAEELSWPDGGTTPFRGAKDTNWQVHFQVQRAEGFDAWQEPFVALRCPMLVNLRMDPFENAELAADVFYKKWRADRIFMLIPAGALVHQYMETMVEFPPRQNPESWSPGAVMEKLRQHVAQLETASPAGLKNPPYHSAVPAPT